MAPSRGPERAARAGNYAGRGLHGLEGYARNVHGATRRPRPQKGVDPENIVKNTKTGSAVKRSGW